MQSRGLFDFFTKAADVRQTAAGARIARDQAAKAIQQQTSAVANNNYAAEQKRRAGMTNRQRWKENFNNHLSDQAGAGKNQYNFAYDNYARDLDAAVARGEITPREAARAKRYAKTDIRNAQRAFHSDYLASFNGGDYTDADRKRIRGAKIWTTHGDNGLVHFRYGDFGENTTFGGAERGYEQRDARMVARTGRGGARGGISQMPNNSQAAPQTPPAASVATGAAQANASNVTPPTPPSPITFKGGYAVNVDPGAVDWSARGDGSIGVRGMRLTQKQYDMYNNIRSQLAGSIAMQGGVDPQTARDQASMLAAQYIGDQINIANGGKAFNSWQHVEKQPAPQPEPKVTHTESPVTSQWAHTESPLTLNLKGNPESPLNLKEINPESPLTLNLKGNPESPLNLKEINPESPLNLKEINPESPLNLKEINPESPLTSPEQQAPQPAPKPTPRLGDAYKDTIWTESGIRAALNAEKTKVAEGLRAIPGYDGLLFTKDGDPTGGIYDRTGKQLTYKGKAINNDLLRTDKTPLWEFWKSGDYGADILHNAHQAMQSRATSNYNDAEMNPLGFTRVPGSRRWYRNAKGQYVDISGMLAPRGITEGQLSHGRTAGQRWVKDTMDPFGLLFAGEREDIGTL